MVQEVKSMPMPTTDSGANPLVAMTAQTVASRPASQSDGFCSAQSGGSESSLSGSRASMTPSANCDTAVAIVSPPSTSTSTARTDSAPKSIPMAHRRKGLVLLCRRVQHLTLDAQDVAQLPQLGNPSSVGAVNVIAVEMPDERFG